MDTIDSQLLRVVDGWQRRQAWPHAVLLTGSERSGLFDQAFYLARRLLCETENACGVCSSCQRVHRRVIDLHLLANSTLKQLDLLGRWRQWRHLIRKEEVLECCRTESGTKVDGESFYAFVLKDE